MKLLREFYELCDGGVCKDLLTEEEKKFINEGGMVLTGKLQEADVKNGNGRVYPFKTLVREVKKYQTLVKERRALGELDHPEDSVINLRNTSHLITDIWMDGKSVMGKARILDTPSGKTLRALVDSGVRLGISSRALGSVNESTEGSIVQDDLSLICFDFVSEPSTPNAFMEHNSGMRNMNERSENKIDSLLKEILKN